MKNFIIPKKTDTLLDLELDSWTKIGLGDFDERRIPQHFPLHDYNPFEERDKDKREEHIEIPVMPKDLVKDMSVKDQRKIEDKENEGKNYYHWGHLYNKK